MLAGDLYRVDDPELPREVRRAADLPAGVRAVGARPASCGGSSSVPAVGYSFGSIDELGDGVFRKVRRALGVKAFGVNVLVLEPGVISRPHWHEEQDELYFVHAGRARFALPGEARELGPGGLCHVESTTPRQVTNVGEEPLVLLVVGAKDGYVGRDGRPADPSQLG